MAKDNGRTASRIASAVLIMAGAALITIGILIFCGKFTLYYNDTVSYSHAIDSEAKAPVTNMGWKAATAVYMCVAGAFIPITGIRAEIRNYDGKLKGQEVENGSIEIREDSPEEHNEAD